MVHWYRTRLLLTGSSGFETVESVGVTPQKKHFIKLRLFLTKYKQGDSVNPLLRKREKQMSSFSVAFLFVGGLPTFSNIVYNSHEYSKGEDCDAQLESLVKLY